MIDRHQAHLIEVYGFFERLHEAEAEPAVFFADGVALDLDEFDRPGNIALSGADPVSHNACAEHVCDKFVTLAVPSKERRAGTAAAVDLHEVLLLVAGDLDFVL